MLYSEKDKQTKALTQSFYKRLKERFFGAHSIMAASVHYFEGNRNIVHMVLDGEWTVQEWLLCSYEASNLIHESAMKVSLLVEYRSHPSYHPPALFANLSYIGCSPLIHERRIQRVVVIGEDGILHTASEVFRQVYRLKRVVVVDNYEQARGLLQPALAH